MFRFLKSCAIGLVACLLSSQAFAHDFWISPNTYTAEVGDPCEIRFEIGHAGHADPFPFSMDHAERFRIISPSGETILPQLPAQVQDTEAPRPCTWTPTAPGLYTIIYESAPRSIEMKPAKFESYLKEEGLDDIVKQRAVRGESDQPGLERYSRVAKSFIAVFDHEAATNAPSQYPAPMHEGLDVELVMLDAGTERPAKQGINRSRTVRLLSKGKPLTNARVDAERLDGDHRSPQHARTNERGEVTFTNLSEGTWLFTCTHMTRAENDPESEDQPQWQSTWASMTCHIPMRASTTRSRSVGTPADD